MNQTNPKASPIVTDAELIDRARGIARCLSYNEPGPEAPAKMTLHELAHRLEKHLPGRVHRKRDGLLWIEACGRSRFLTWRERFVLRFTGFLPNGTRLKA